MNNVAGYTEGRTQCCPISVSVCFFKTPGGMEVDITTINGLQKGF